MCEDVDEDEATRPWIKHNSIHHSNSRCVTVHGTHGFIVNMSIKLQGHGSNTIISNTLRADVLLFTEHTVGDYVCYMTKGHGYFLENGGEKRTGRGYWYTYPRIPLGSSADKGYMLKDETKHTVISEFDNNVAHSNKQFIDQSVFIDSPNLGETATMNGQPVSIGRSFPLISANMMESFNPRKRIALRRGPIYVTDVFLDGFADNEYYQMGAISWDKMQGQSPFHSITNAQFDFSDPSEGNRVKGILQDETTRTGDDIRTFRDMDNSMIGLDVSDDSVVTVLSPEAFRMTEECKIRTKSVRLGVCIPSDASFRVFGGMVKWAAVDSYLVMFLSDSREFEPGEVGECVGEGEMCRRVMIKIESGDLTQTGCLSAAHYSPGLQYQIL
ncbi:TEME2 [Mytilus coruscus]|uniref:TEME2 n=1 Tax=Mytilus coruscus TaxID=42192 RepID=A0A6J8EPK5_MYTCO|nr:TEME2 [Mytilus coruscus]